MLKKTLLIFILLPFTFLTSFKKVSNQPVLKTIIIDSGHGGIDQGADGIESTEARICLEISKKLGEQIEKEIPGVNVLYTRKSNIFPGNQPTKQEGDRYRA